MAEKTKGPLPLDEQLCYAIYSAGMAIQRTYKPLLDDLGLTYPQYLVLNVLWREGAQTVGAIAERIGLESSTLTPLLKRLEASKLVERTRNPENERQVVVSVTAKGKALQGKAACLGEALLAASGQSPRELMKLKEDVRRLRDTIYRNIGGWNLEGERAGKK
ncbi:MAG: MarR family transcriptional regulator [Xanthobacteraceae bacterium]|nr:MarR family transcriptional regulator [Xanthobacteraceae bacterium]QYK45964.1 MAG: MarR family transcriptional regulator [Xanthobacteraceae bacterium]